MLATENGHTEIVQLLKNAKPAKKTKNSNKEEKEYEEYEFNKTLEFIRGVEF